MVLTSLNVGFGLLNYFDAVTYSTCWVAFWNQPRWVSLNHILCNICLVAGCWSWSWLLTLEWGSPDRHAIGWPASLSLSHTHTYRVLNQPLKFNFFIFSVFLYFNFIWLCTLTFLPFWYLAFLAFSDGWTWMDMHTVAHTVLHSSGNYLQRKSHVNKYSLRSYI